MSEDEECEHNRSFWECEICGNVKHKDVLELRIKVLKVQLERLKKDNLNYRVTIEAFESELRDLELENETLKARINQIRELV